MTLSMIVKLVVAVGVYESLSIQYQKAKVRTDVKEACLLREISRNPTLVHIRDGVGQAKAGIPLLIETSLGLIKTTEHLSAWLKYAQKLGFQFKVFVEESKKNRLTRRSGASTKG
jgi:hypothetical protein